MKGVEGRLHVSLLKCLLKAGQHQELLPVDVLPPQAHSQYITIHPKYTHNIPQAHPKHTHDTSQYTPITLTIHPHPNHAHSMQPLLTTLTIYPSNTLIILAISSQPRILTTRATPHTARRPLTPLRSWLHHTHNVRLQPVWQGDLTQSVQRSGWL